MAASPLLSLLLYLTCLPAVSAWIFSWHQPGGKLLTVQDDVGQDCKLMNNPKGNVFDWDPQEGYWCIFLYGNTNCEEPSVGYTCKTYPWRDHVSSAELLSFKVKNDTSAFGSSTSSTSSTSSSSSASTAEPSTSASPSSTDTTSTPTIVTTPTADTTDAASSSPATSASSGTIDEPTISGGAIAGIVVGVLGAVAIAGLVFFLIRRRRQNAAQSHVVAGGSATVAMSELPSPLEEKSHGLHNPMYRAQGFRELRGSDVASEIGSGVERYELDSTQIYPDKKY